MEDLRPTLSFVECRRVDISKNMFPPLRLPLAGVSDEARVKVGQIDSSNVGFCAFLVESGYPDYLMVEWVEVCDEYRGVSYGADLLWKALQEYPDLEARALDVPNGGARLLNSVGFQLKGWWHKEPPHERSEKR